MNKIPGLNQIGKEYFRLPDQKSLEGDKYFDCIDRLRPLFSNPDFMVSTPGFYLNWITNTKKDGDDDKNSLRLTYLSINPLKSFKVIEDFERTNLKEIKIYDSKTKIRSDREEILMPNRNSPRFMNFLNINTQIALDLLRNYGRHQTKDLVYNYRNKWAESFLNGPSPKSELEAIFLANSDYFRNLKKESLDNQYWDDLVHDFGRSDGIGLHFLVNMIGIPPWYLLIISHAQSPDQKVIYLRII
ncbi:hypothetical protein AMJ51_01050 [Microgenomates bacterium DG_75]|nr:MAG: hypothetical protein AMJ51_01050 [Microgenomates bacterium DG_75]